MIVAVAAVSSLLLSPVRADGVAADVMAAGAYVMNWHLSAEAVDYFASGAQDGPLDHFWSLAVEEQFYLVWPLLLLVTWRSRRGGGSPRARRRARRDRGRVARCTRSARPRRPRAGLLLGPCAGVGAGAGRAAAAVRSPGAGWPRAAAAAAAWAGVGGDRAPRRVASATGRRSRARPALLPTLGAAALLAAGTSACRRRRRARWRCGRCAASAACRTPGTSGTGRRSSSRRPRWGRCRPPRAWRWSLASLVPTVVTHRWIEEPLRRSKLHVRRPRITLAAAAGGPGAGGRRRRRAVGEHLVPAGARRRRGRGRAPSSSARDAIQRAATALRPRPRDAERRPRARVRRRVPGRRAARPRSPPCVYGDRGSQTTVVLFGDSHAMQYFPALEQIARAPRAGGWSSSTKAGCPPPRVRVIYAPSRREYPRVRRVARARAAADRARSGRRWSWRGVGALHAWSRGGRRLGADASMRALADGYAPTLRRLRARGRPRRRARGRAAPAVGRPGVRLGGAATTCAAAPSRGAGGRPRARRSARRSRGSRASASSTRRAGTASPTLCPAVIGDVLVYRNSGHVTATSCRDAARRGSARRLQRSARTVRPNPGDADADRSRAYYDGCHLDFRANGVARVRLRAAHVARRRSCCSATRMRCSTSRRRRDRAGPRLAARPSQARPDARRSATARAGSGAKYVFERLARGRADPRWSSSAARRTTAAGHLARGYERTLRRLMRGSRRTSP